MSDMGLIYNWGMAPGENLAGIKHAKTEITPLAPST